MGLVKAMQENKVAVLAHGATGRGNDQMRFERYTNVLAPNMAVYAPWRDPGLLEEFPGRTEMAAYLNKFGIEASQLRWKGAAAATAARVRVPACCLRRPKPLEMGSCHFFNRQAFVGPKKKYSTDANLAGLSHEAEDLESVETSMLIVEPEMGKWPSEAPDAVEEVELEFEAARCVAINGKRMTPLEVIKEANEIGGRNGIGVSHALENRIIGTKSRGAPRRRPAARRRRRPAEPGGAADGPRTPTSPSLAPSCRSARAAADRCSWLPVGTGVYEAPGMQLLGQALEFVYQAVMDRRATKLFNDMSRLVSDQIYDGRYYDPTTTAAFAAIKELTKHAKGRVRVGAYKGNIFFLKLDQVPNSLYNEADSSMEASDGLNPVSSQGYAEIQAVEARSLALAGQIAAPTPAPPAKKARRS